MRKALSLVAAVLAAAAGLSCGGGSEPAAAETHPPVVMILLDEFSTTSLTDRDGRIDPVRYPNFAQLAKDGTWFPYATASLDETGRAITSLFTGRNIRKHTRPTYENGRRNIFTLMAGRYRMNVHEEVSNMCPRRLCKSSRPQNRHTILRKLEGGRRSERFNAWVRGIRPSSKPTFYFNHSLLPHGPWEYLPTGNRFDDGPTQRLYSFRLEHFNRFLVQQSYQRHLLNVGFTDRLIGAALKRLRETGLYDRSLIVVSADNGESFGRTGNGHELSGRSAIDIALTPLLIKMPNQRRAGIDRRHVRTMDLLPTIARIAHVRVPGRLDGHSIFGRASRRIPSTTTLYTREGGRIRMSLRTLRRRADESRRLKLGLFGSGRDSLFEIGPHADLHGQRVSEFPVLKLSRVRARIDARSRYSQVQRSSGTVPVRVMGGLSGRGSSRRRDLAVAVNGTIVATGPTFAPAPKGRQLFSVLVPEASLRDGRNAVAVYAIGAGNYLRRLTP